MIVCFSGWKGSGKDSLAAHLIEKYQAVRVSFADPLKDMVAEEYEIDRASLDDPKRKESPLLHLPVDPKDGFSKNLSEFLFKEFTFSTGEKPIGFSYENDKFYGDHSNGGAFSLFWSPRALAILKGSSNRAVRPDFWTNKAFDKTEQLLKDGTKIVVISDLRYKSEMKQITDRFKDEVVSIRINRFKESPSQDPSERDLDDSTFDYYIDNTHSLENSYNQLNDILNRIVRK